MNDRVRSDMTMTMTTIILTTSILSAILILSPGGQGYSQMMPPDFQSPSNSGENPQMMPPGGEMSNGLSGVPQMPGGFQIPKMVEGKYANAEFGLEMVFAEGLKGMEMSTPGSTNVMVNFGGGPGGMASGPGGMGGNPSSGGSVGMPDMTMFMVSLNDPSKMEQTNDTTSTTLDSNVTNQMNIPINKTELPKIDCKPSASETVNIGGKNAQSSTSECSMSSSNPKGTMYTKAKDYTIDLGDGKSANLRYSVMSSSSLASAASAYDTNVGKFEESVKTIKFTN